MTGNGESLTKVGGEKGEERNPLLPISLPFSRLQFALVRVSCWGELKKRKSKMGGFWPLTGKPAHWLEIVLVPDYSDQRCLGFKITNIGYV